MLALRHCKQVYIVLRISSYKHATLKFYIFLHIYTSEVLHIFTYCTLEILYILTYFCVVYSACIHTFKLYNYATIIQQRCIQIHGLIVIYSKKTMLLSVINDLRTERTFVAAYYLLPSRDWLNCSMITIASYIALLLPPLAINRSRFFVVLDCLLFGSTSEREWFGWLVFSVLMLMIRRKRVGEALEEFTANWYLTFVFRVHFMVDDEERSTRGNIG